MAQANLVHKKAKMEHRDIIKYQIITHCFINNIKLSDAGLKCLTVLAECEICGLSEFCNIIVDERIFKTTQTVRNFLTQVEHLGIIIKKGTNKKTVQIKESLQIQIKGNIILNYQFIHVSEKS